MMFDIERAKAGDPIETLYHGEWLRVRFVGMVSGERVAAEWVSGETIIIATPEYFRMAPKKVTWYCRHHVYDGRPEMYKSLTPIAENAVDSWLGVPFTIEV